nr:reverse transcriptase domain-containing protein [Tanacetum cinerariifolium]
MTAMLKQFQATPPPAQVKAVEEIYVTCGGADPYYQCLAASGNTFLKFKDNIHGYVSAAAVNYNQDPRVPLILGRPFLRTTRALIDVHGEEMILRNGDERLTLNMKYDTSSYSNQPPRESVNLINIFNVSSEDFLDVLFSNQPSGKPTFSPHQELTSPKVTNDIFDSEGCKVLSEKLLDLNYTKDLHPPLDDNLLIESDAENVYDDPFDSKGEKIQESKLLIDELDLPCDFLPPFKYDSFISQDFSRVDAFPSTNNEDKDKKLAISNASLVLEDFDPPFYEPLFFKEVPKSKMLIPFSSENKEKQGKKHLLQGLVKDSLSIRPTTSDKEIELWVELKRLYEPDVEDQLWTHTQDLMHALVEWKLYDTCRVHHVSTKDQDIFMLIEKDYPLRKGLAIVMISYKLQGRIVGNKMHKAFPLLVMKFPLPEEVPTANEESSPGEEKRCHCCEVCTATKVKKDMDQRMNKAVKVSVQIHSDRLYDEGQAENDEFLKTIDENMQKIIKEQVKEHVKTSYAIVTDLSEMELKKILIEKMEGNKSIHRSNEQRNLYKALVEAYESDKIILYTYRDTVTLKRRRDDDDDKDEEPSARSDWGSKRRSEGKEPESASAPQEKATRSAGKLTQGSKSRQTSASEYATAEEPMQTTFEMEEPSHPEFAIGADDQPIVESSQHPECIQPWISELAKQSDSRSSFNELMDTPVDFSNFLMNRLKVDTLTPELLAGPTYELMKGSCKSLVELKFFMEEVYKAMTDQLDWVNPEGQQYPHNLLKPLPLISNSRGHRVIQFDHFINNDLEYLSWRCLKPQVYYFCHQDKGNRLQAHQITVRRDDDKLYKFKEGDFKRLCIQDIEDMLLLFVQGKLTNLTVKERFAFNVSLRMFTRSIVIQRRMEDLQLGVKSYQKKLNLTRSDTYRSDLKRKEAYSAYSNPRGFIYQNNDKQNRLMRIDELHKFSDGTLIDVRTSLDDHLKGIRMKYLPKSI